MALELITGPAHAGKIAELYARYLDELAHGRAAAVCVALGRADRHARRGRDLLEREAERVLQHEDTRLRLGQAGEPVPQACAELGELGLVQIGRAHV